MSTMLLERARSRRRIALNCVSTRKAAASVFKKYRKTPSLTPSEHAEFLKTSRQYRPENLFVN